jgi:hypothetical protein
MIGVWERTETSIATTTMTRKQEQKPRLPLR